MGFSRGFAAGAAARWQLLFAAWLLPPAAAVCLLPPSHQLPAHTRTNSHTLTGKYNKNPYTLWEWVTMLIIPPGSKDIDTIVNMGEHDAAAWAREHGLVGEAQYAKFTAQALKNPRRKA